MARWVARSTAGRSAGRMPRVKLSTLGSTSPSCAMRRRIRSSHVELTGVEVPVERAYRRRIDGQFQPQPRVVQRSRRTDRIGR